MKKIPLLVLLSVVALSCSSPKYTYYFDRVKTTPPVAAAEIPFTTVKPEELVASTETAPYEVVTPVVKEEVATDVTNSPKDDEPKKRGKLRQKLAETRALLKDYAEKSTDSNKKTKAKPESLAIAGFVMSVVGWIIPYGIILLIVAAFLCGKGLKSERHGLALAGLILSILGIIFLVAYAASQAQ